MPSTGTHLFRVDISRPGSQTVTVTDPGTASASFGDFQLGSVSGQVFNDLNGNGVQDPGEPGLAGWRVYLDGNGNGQYDFWEPSAVTDANGNYTLTGLRANTYTLAESLRGPGWSQTEPAGQPYTVTINASGQNLTGLNLGNHLSGVGPVGPESLVNVNTAGKQG
jgi:serine-aspartate repeat-containing protein C/D/E